MNRMQAKYWAMTRQNKQLAVTHVESKRRFVFLLEDSGESQAFEEESALELLARQAR